MKIKKPSRRQTLNRKYNIQKKVKEHNRKVKKQARVAKKVGVVVSKKRRDPGIPNSWPFKQEVLNDMEKRKKEVEANRKRERELRKKGLPVQPVVSKKNQDKVVKSLAELKSEAERCTRLYDRSADALIGSSSSVRDMHSVSHLGTNSREAQNTRRAYYRELRKVMGMADVVVEVLDARDPMSCRCKSLEEEVLTNGKKVILLLNKIDLVPKEAVQAWLAYLRKDFPTIAFKAARTSGDRQTGRAIAAETAPEGLLKSSYGVVGSDALLQLLKNYARSVGTGRISVGIVGFPNVGKSSVINSMKGVHLKTGNRAGITKQMQEVQIDKTVSLLDCPGVIFSGTEESASNTSSLVIRQSVNVDALEDPMPVVEALVKRTPRNAVLKHFKMPAFESVTELVGHVCRTRGKLRRGGAPDFRQGAKDVLREWTTGRLRFFCMPPAADKGKVFAKVVAAASPEFDIDALFSQADTCAEAAAGVELNGSANHAAQSGDMGIDMLMDDTDSSEEEEEDEDEEEGAPILIDEATEEKKTPARPQVEKRIFTGLNPRVNRDIKKRTKEVKRNEGKKERRQQAEQTEASDTAMDDDDSYDFQRDFK
ncbi:Nuclear GTP-binding protein NUG1, putative [Perkinsus marinus ATCC 50983]|uniref:Nuclear GTP-binding protein NUG1, putative n=1 Tax=Perkinsus marinus (strain ATCC 50983 / TXsc) TaxID=423536 RepID=C5KAC0_PERM5|nr:Nuclear GTP-binding protein NUG1, putative [Perkinsus marinus ATCC 50983]EER18581.1 Nuclear GTP-binding protein NUG1, putative [Perkinsus marinus ATCC 50983]|eukprot:XP_002786785.1 Nuclear GTP-binding protein NUG1, putative [Perkinsus marinus ATCC 50983]